MPSLLAPLSVMAIAAVSILALSGCGGASKPSGTDTSRLAASKTGQQTAPINGAARNDYAAVTKRLLAAAEPFEGLTESAFTDPAAKLDASITIAERAAQSVRDALPTQAYAQLDAKLAEVRRARRANNRADLALASIEGYRILVSAVPGAPVVPIDVSLLDYAGFRYNANTQATPPRWDDMTRATDFARQRWSSLENKQLPASLGRRLVESLVAMESAAKRRDVVAARASAKTELDLVDELEAAFQPVVRAKP